MRARNPKQIYGNFVPSGQGNFESRYWEWVPTSEIWRFREHGGDRDFDSESNVQALMKSLQKNGWQDMLILKYYHGDRTATLSEGNHRFEAAQRLKLAFVPVRVWRVEREGGEYRRKVRGWIKEGHVPADPLPSQIGLTGYSDKELYNAFVFEDARA
jgi:hypothetical protein